MRSIFLGLLFLLMSIADIIAQEADVAKPQIFINLAQNDEESGKIEIIQPVQIENLLKIQIANNRLKEGIPGYRIQIFSQAGQTARARAEDLRRDFMKSFPEIEAHYGYYQPNWQVKVGDFRTKNEALLELQAIKRRFPGAFIVSEIIQIQQ